MTLQAKCRMHPRQVCGLLAPEQPAGNRIHAPAAHPHLTAGAGPWLVLFCRQPQHWRQRHISCSLAEFLTSYSQRKQVQHLVLAYCPAWPMVCLYMHVMNEAGVSPNTKQDRLGGWWCWSNAGIRSGGMLGTLKDSSRKNWCVTLSPKAQMGCQQRTHGMNTDYKWSTWVRKGNQSLDLVELILGQRKRKKERLWIQHISYMITTERREKDGIKGNHSPYRNRNNRRKEKQIASVLSPVVKDALCLINAATLSPSGFPYPFCRELLLFNLSVNLVCYCRQAGWLKLWSNMWLHGHVPSEPTFLHKLIATLEKLK